MLAQPKNRVQAIKSKFESLNTENEILLRKKTNNQLSKQVGTANSTNIDRCGTAKDIINKTISHEEKSEIKHELSTDDWSAEPNTSYLYSISDVKRSLGDGKTTLTRQSSDPGKKLHRSHAFRCDRSIKINPSPKRHGSCNGRSETSDFSFKMGEKKLSKERLKQLGNFLEVQMKKENFQPNSESVLIVGEVHENIDSIPDSQVPKHILDQYAKVVKSKKEDKIDSMPDSGVSSETENLEEDKSSKIKRIISQYEKTENIVNIAKSKPDSESANDLCASSETMKLERKNPHLKLTDTLKKALKQPLPSGPPPKKPPRTFIAPINESPEKSKKDTKKMLEKLEEALQKKEAQKNMYDIVEKDETPKPKEIHYLCTNIADLTQRTLMPLNQNVKTPISKCFNSLNCAIVGTNSTLSLPYTKLSNNDMNGWCSCSKENLNELKRLSTFKDTEKCVKCQVNDNNDGFKCHLNCKCRENKSEFYVKEHIYDEPFVDMCKSERQYGTLNSWKLHGAYSRSLEDLKRISEDQKIYDIPCDVSRPSTPPPQTDFQKLISSFEKPSSTSPKSILNNKVWRSSENVCDDYKVAKRVLEKRFATEVRRYKKNDKMKTGECGKRDGQLDVDRENLNRLMSEIYETVTAACNMDENKPGSFPTESSDATSEGNFHILVQNSTVLDCGLPERMGSEKSVKLTRSLTEKRKNYVRRVSSRVAYLEPRNIKSTRFRHQTSVCSYKSEIIDNPYSTFRSWKSFRNSQSNLSRDKMERNDSTDSKINLTDSCGNILSSMKDDSDASLDNLSIDEQTGCVDIDLPFEPREKGLFNVCLLVGLNYLTGQAYVKSVFPCQVKVPQHIENLIFPETLSPGSLGEWSAEKNAQCYSMVLTEEKGERAYGYCRRVLPEGATTCLPLCYCLIGKYRAPGFYYKILKEIESQHGNSEVGINKILQQLFETDFPNPGEQISITYNCRKCTDGSEKSVNLEEVHKSQTMPDTRRVGCSVTVKREMVGPGTEEVDGAEGVDDHTLSDFYDLENNNSPKTLMLDVESPRTQVIKRPIDPRADEDNMSVLLDSFGAGLVMKVFGSLLLERKVIIISDQLSVVSSCLEALQGALYPFVWQQPLISTIPAKIQRDVLEAPLPILAGMLRSGTDDVSDVQFEEGMLIDLTSPNKVLLYQGDESTILPTSSYKSLKTALQMESIKNKDKEEDTKTRNVMIAEAFLRYFVDILGDFWRFFSIGELKDGDFGKNGVIFDRESFVKNAKTKQIQYFLEWFTETAMFYHFIQNMALCYRHPPTPTPTDDELVDTPLPDFYELFHERVNSRNKSDSRLNDTKVNYKSAVNRKVKLLKTKLRDLVA